MKMFKLVILFVLFLEVGGCFNGRCICTLNAIKCKRNVNNVIFDDTWHTLVSRVYSLELITDRNTNLQRLLINARFLRSLTLYGHCSQYRKVGLKVNCRR